jgi:branched-chain amino acid transport system ATP-binding protein
MLAMAQAYVKQPRLVLVDEASLGLAPLVVDVIFEFLSKVTEQGTSLLVVDQFVTRALEMADVAFVLRRGEINYVGDPKALLEGDLFQEYLGLAPADAAPVGKAGAEKPAAKRGGAKPPRT